jgi:AraC family transcriptional regulator
MTPRIETINEKKLVGKRMTMSYADYKIAELWSSFMPRRKEIKNNLSYDLISMVVYHPTHFEDFRPTNKFERWAAVEVANFDKLPDEMETCVLPASLYAVFHYKGSSTGSASFFQQIYTVWLPASDYVLDNRPHFEVLGDKYKNNDPSSEEDIWIPIKPKAI